MLEITSKWMRDADNQIDRNDFAGGYALYCFEIEPNFGNEGNYITLVKQGNVRLEAKFAKSLKKSDNVHTVCRISWIFRNQCC